MIYSIVMRILEGKDLRNAENWMKQALIFGKKASCNRAHCGSIIVKDEKLIGGGFNSPPQNKESQRKCSYSKDEFHKKVTDKTCCIHAEQRAIMDALRKNPSELSGSKLYFIRLDDAGKISYAGKPYCTICSKMALDTGIKEFVLWHEEGIAVYDTEEYNLLSYQYQ